MKKQPYAQRYIRIWIKESQIVKPEFVGREILLPQHFKVSGNNMYWQWGSYADIVNTNRSISHNIAIGIPNDNMIMTDEEFLKTKKTCMNEKDPNRQERCRNKRAERKLKQLKNAKHKRPLMGIEL